MLTEQQLKNRAGKIGMSDIPTIVGVNAWKSPARLAGELIGVVARSEAGLAARVGNHMESVIAEEGAKELGVPFYTNETDLTSIKLGVAPFGHTINHPTYPWLVCHCDYAVIKNGQPVSIIEVKNVGPNMRDRWGDPADGIAGVPDYVQTQAIGQCGMTGVYDAHVFGYFGGNDLRIYHFNPLPADWEYVLNRIKCFWEYVEKRQVPPITACEDMKWAGAAFLALRPEGAPVTHVASETMQDWLKQYKLAQREAKAAQETADIIKTKIQDTMRDCEVLTSTGDTVLATWKQNKPTRRLDTKRLMTVYAELRDLSLEEVEFAFSTESPGARVFRVK